MYFLIIIIILYLWTEFSLLEVRPNQDGGALRASMGHPKPFDLRIVTIGNEDCGKFNYKGMFLLVFYIYFLACWVSYHISFILIGIQFCFSRNLKFYGCIIFCVFYVKKEKMELKILWIHSFSISASMILLCSSISIKCMLSIF